MDGFSPLSIGRLVQKGREPLFVPCTPFGCIFLLEQPGLKIDGAKAVVLGRSNIVGMPAALLPLRQNATVTICHSRNRDLPGMIRQADILIAAITRAACSNASATVCYICKKVLDFTHQSAYYTNTYNQPQFALIDGTGVRFSH